MPEWCGLVAGCRIVDVCKGFGVTTMCLSCEKLQSKWPNMWLPKQGVPKNNKNKIYINKTCFKKGSGWKGGKTNKNKQYFKEEKPCKKEKFSGLKTKNKTIRNPISAAFYIYFEIVFALKIKN